MNKLPVGRHQGLGPGDESAMDRVDINHAAGNWHARDEATVRAAVAAAFDLLRTRKILAGSIELSVLLSDNESIRDLNKTHRGKNRPTNVLSFPLPSQLPYSESEIRLLGDIALARETIAREAAEQNKQFAAHLSHLAVHGLLHLLGFDHEEGEAEAAVMEALEHDIMSALGFSDPYRDTYEDAERKKTAAGVSAKGDMKAGL